MNQTGQFRWLVVANDNPRAEVPFILTLEYIPTGEQRKYGIVTFHNHPDVIDNIWANQKPI